ncbi:hypothetical protein ACS0TY_027780 [Phlomoides rotata]
MVSKQVTCLSRMGRQMKEHGLRFIQLEIHSSISSQYLGNNLPLAPEVIALCKQHNIQRIRIYNPDPSILEALQGQPNSLIVGVVNNDIPGIANNPSLATSWVQNNILKYQNINFRYIAVGNEISPSSDPTIAPFIAPAMQNIHNALSALGLIEKIKVSMVLSMVVLGQSYPSSAGAFATQSQDTFINPIVKFPVETNAPFLIDVYPYCAYADQMNKVLLDYALFTSPSTVVRDGEYEYQNLFDAMKAGGANVEVVMTETGWPSDGGIAATINNAMTYNSHLVGSVKRGTPKGLGKPIETYIFDLIDENQKSPELEKHWGVFLPNKQPKYPLSFNININEMAMPK